MKETTPVWESLDEELKQVTIEEKKISILREDHERLLETDVRELPVRLLPGFDPFLLAHAEKDHLVTSEHYKRVYRNQGWITPVVISNGRVIGIWSIEQDRKGVSVDIKPFEKLSKILQAGVVQEVGRLETFFEL